MEYTKTSCKITPDTEINREIVVAELGCIGYESFTETDDLIEAYIGSNDFSPEALSELFPFDYPSFRVSFTNEKIADENWNEVWEKNYFQPLLIADRCLIRAPYHTDYPLAEYEIIIEPAMAFGTGNHETTTLMIGEILNQNLDGKTVLDMGCGTGILSILASKRGAKTITAIDVDNWAINSTIENASYNFISDLEIILGGAEVIPDTSYDMIYANIHRNIILTDMNRYVNVLKKGGELILSGFYSDDLLSIEDKAKELGLILKKVAENQNWIAATFTSK